MWIAKPSLTNQAVAVCIFDRVQQLRSALEAAPDLREWVLQRQVARWHPPCFLASRLMARASAAIMQPWFGFLCLALDNAADPPSMYVCT